MRSTQTGLDVALDFIALTDKDQCNGDGNNDDNGSQNEAPYEIS